MAPKQEVTMSDANAETPSAVEILQAGGATGTWTLDAAASSAEFAVKHFWGLMTVRGRLEQIQGHAEVSGEGGITASLGFDSASVQTGNAARDRHLRSDDFFAADKHPTVTFSTSKVTLTDQNRARVQGELTAAGRAQQVDLDVTLQAGASRLVVDGEVTVDHTTFGMTWSPLRMAAPTSTLRVHLVFTHAG
jgi:polyisoprenoid-binding protein YceI